MRMGIGCHVADSVKAIAVSFFGGAAAFRDIPSRKFVGLKLLRGPASLRNQRCYSQAGSVSFVRENDVDALAKRVSQKVRFTSAKRYNSGIWNRNLSAYER